MGEIINRNSNELIEGSAYKQVLKAETDEAAVKEEFDRNREMLLQLKKELAENSGNDGNPEKAIQLAREIELVEKNMVQLAQRINYDKDFAVHQKTGIDALTGHTNGVTENPLDQTIYNEIENPESKKFNQPN